MYPECREEMPLGYKLHPGKGKKYPCGVYFNIELNIYFQLFYAKITVCIQTSMLKIFKRMNKMNKLLLISALAVSVLIANPGNKGVKKVNKGSVHSSLKGANSTVKPNKLKKGDSILDIDKKNNKLEREVQKEVIKAVL